MGNLDFSFNLEATPEQLMKLSEDYEKLPKYLPDQLKSVKILEINKNETKTEEVIAFSTILTKEIIQQTIHKKIDVNKLHTEIISGPAKGTTINTVFKKNKIGTEIIFELNLKLSLKAKILQPLIKKYYKMILTSILYKMNNEILESTKDE